jgi:DNA-directed RNA polymerase subunit beta
MITSVNLAAIPFIAQTDSTRLQMSSKQIQQSLTTLKCEKPYVISNTYYTITNSSKLGIRIAEDDGEVLFQDDYLIIYVYKNLQQSCTDYIPKLQKTHSVYCSELRHCLKTGDKFRKGDIIWEYDCFYDGIPSFGYNTHCLFIPFFGYNHEDAIVASESFCERASYKRVERIFIPIYEFTLLKKLYSDVEGSLKYFPNIGQKINGEIVCAILRPKASTLSTHVIDSRSERNNIISMLKLMNINDLLTFNSENSLFRSENITSKIKDGIVTGIRIHKLRKDVSLIDIEFENVLNYLCVKYGEILMQKHSELMTNFNENFVKYIITNNYYITKSSLPQDISKNAIWILEFEISKEDKTYVGDKFANRYANKGVISLIIPDELRPIGLKSKIPVDMIFNPFGVFSRMNNGQIIEGIIQKAVYKTDYEIKTNKTLEPLIKLNELVIKNINKEYSNEIKKHINEDYNEILKDILQSNLFIECPQFGKIDIKNIKQLIHKNIIPISEPILIKKKLIDYIKDKFKHSLLPKRETIFDSIKHDITIPNKVLYNNYVLKLSKIANEIVHARDIGPVKSITHQPVRGKIKKGGIRLGQMELEALIAHDCESFIKELMTVKSDNNSMKKDLLRQIIKKGEYNMIDIYDNENRTRVAIETIVKFLKE